MMSLWDALRMNMMISYQELVRTFPSIIPENLSGNIDKLINQTLDFIRGAPDFGGAVDKEIILVK